MKEGFVISLTDEATGDELGFLGTIDRNPLEIVSLPDEANFYEDRSSMRMALAQAQLNYPSYEAKSHKAIMAIQLEKPAAAAAATL